MLSERAYFAESRCDSTYPSGGVVCASGRTVETVLVGKDGELAWDPLDANTALAHLVPWAAWLREARTYPLLRASSASIVEVVERQRREERDDAVRR